MAPQIEQATTLTSTSQDNDVLQEPLLPPRSNVEGSSNSSNNNNNNAIDGSTTIEKNIVLPAWCNRCCTSTAYSSPLPHHPQAEEVSSRQEQQQQQEVEQQQQQHEGKLVVNYNVFLNLLLAVLYGISNSLWNGTAYAAYLKTLGGGINGPLGDIEAVEGLASLIAALPMGYVADKIGRSRVIRAGGLAMLVTIVAQVGVLEWVGTSSVEQPFEAFVSNDGDDIMQPQQPLGYNRKAALWMMGVIMAFWGIGDGVVNGPCMALFADSTPEGERTKYFNYLFVCYTAASACGPLVSILLFQTLGDVWDMYHLRIVIYEKARMERASLSIESLHFSAAFFASPVLIKGNCKRKCRDANHETKEKQTNERRLHATHTTNI